MGKATDIAVLLRSLLERGQGREFVDDDDSDDEQVSAARLLLEMGMPVTPAALVELSGAYSEMGFPDKALAAVEAAVKRKPADDGPALLQRGLVLASMERFEDALRDFVSAERSPRTHRTALVNAGAALAKLGRAEEALDFLKRAAAESPGDPIVLVNLGAVLIKLGRLDAARETLRVAVARGPGIAKAWYDLACAEAASGERDGMIEALEGALRADASLADKADSDPDFDSFRQDPELVALLARFRDDGEGRTMLQ